MEPAASPLEDDPLRKVSSILAELKQIRLRINARDSAGHNEEEDEEQGEEEEETNGGGGKGLTLVGVISRLRALFQLEGGLTGKLSTVQGVQALMDAVHLALSLAKEDLADPVATLNAAHELTQSVQATETLSRVLSKRQKDGLKDSQQELLRLLAQYQSDDQGMVMDHKVTAGADQVLQTKLDFIGGHAPGKIAQIEEVRSRLERSLRRRFPDCSVVVFGSSLSELATPHSDIDLSLVLPAIQQRTEALEEQMRAATAEYTRLCAEAPDVMMVQLNIEKCQKKVDRQRGHLRRVREKLDRLRKEVEQDKFRLTQLKEQLQEGDTPTKQGISAERKLASSTKALQIAEKQFGEACDGLEMALNGIRDLESSLRAMDPGQVRPLEDVRNKIKDIRRKVFKDQDLVFTVKNILKDNGYQELFAINRARVPLVKFVCPFIENGNASVQCDLCINNNVAVFNTHLIASYCAIDSRCKALIFLVKAWAKARGLNDAHQGSLSSYSYSLLVIFYLQRMGVVPNLQDPHLLHGVPRETCQGLDVTFCSDMQRARSSLPDPSPSATLTLGALMAGFFHFYGYTVNPVKDTISIREATLLDKRTIWPKGKLWRLSIEDPFEAHSSIRPHDLGNVLMFKAQQRIIEEFRTSYRLLTEGPPEDFELLFNPRNPPQKRSASAKDTAAARPPATTTTTAKSKRGHPDRDKRDRGDRKGGNRERGGTMAPHAKVDVNPETGGGVPTLKISLVDAMKGTRHTPPQPHRAPNEKPPQDKGQDRQRRASKGRGLPQADRSSQVMMGGYGRSVSDAQGSEGERGTRNRGGRRGTREGVKEAVQMDPSVMSGGYGYAVAHPTKAQGEKENGNTTTSTTEDSRPPKSPKLELTPR